MWRTRAKAFDGHPPADVRQMCEQMWELSNRLPSPPMDEEDCYRVVHILRQAAAGEFNPLWVQEVRPNLFRLASDIAEVAERRKVAKRLAEERQKVVQSHSTAPSVTAWGGGSRRHPHQGLAHLLNNILQQAVILAVPESAELVRLVVTCEALLRDPVIVDYHAVEVDLSRLVGKDYGASWKQAVQPLALNANMLISALRLGGPVHQKEETREASASMGMCR